MFKSLARHILVAVLVLVIYALPLDDLLSSKKGNTFKINIDIEHTSGEIEKK